MMLRFLTLEWRQYFRSSYWQKGIALKLIIGVLVVYFIGVFLVLGIASYYILREEFPEKDPLQVVNSSLLYVILGDLVVRYLMQKLPVMQIKPFLNVPIKKRTLVHFVLRKSSFSVFNSVGLFFYIPFSIVLIKEGYSFTGVLGWLFLMFSIIQSSNFLNFLIHKNTVALGVLLSLLGTFFLFQKFNLFDVAIYVERFFNVVYLKPGYSFFGILLLTGLYIANYKQLRNQVYLDQAISFKVQQATSLDLLWTERLGDVAPFIKNDIRLIWRNKRTKTVFLLSFLFLFYGLLFFTQSIYREMPAMLMFASLFVTGGFTLNYGQFIPAWDSAHYKLLMSQGFRYRKFLESKWLLMVVMTGILYLLSVPYLYFGVDIFLMITSGAIFNLGFNSLLLLYAGSFNRKRIDLTKSGFGNTQGTSATQFLLVIPLMLFPMLLFWTFDKFVGYNSGYLVVALVGLLTLIAKNPLMNFIEKKYIQDKYTMIKSFDKEA